MPTTGIPEEPEITRLVGTAKPDKQVPCILVHNPTGNVGFFVTHIRVIGLPVTSGESAPRSVAEMNRRLTVQTDAFGRLLLSVDIFEMNVLKN